MLIQRNPVGSSSTTIKSRNMSTILLMLLRYEQISRVSLARQTGLSTTTITNLIAELIDAGIVEQEHEPNNPPQRRSVGRPQVALNLVPGARYAVGIHFDVGSVRINVMDLLANIVSSDTFEHPLDSPAESVLKDTRELTKTVIHQANIDRKKIVGVGVGASGLVEPFTGVNVVAPNMNWHNIPLKDYFANALRLPVIIDNNVRAMALGEALFGVGKDVYSLAFVYARIGVGAGIVVGGQLYYGGGAGAGEIGHMTIQPHGGPQCRCGNTGCLETLISEPVILRKADQIIQQQPNGRLAQAMQEEPGRRIKRVFAAAQAGDSTTQQMLEEHGYYMGVALANLVNILNPELLILGGILAEGSDTLLPIIQDTMRHRAFAGLGDTVQLAAPSFNHNSGVIGAASLALNHFFYRQVEGATTL